MNKPAKPDALTTYRADVDFHYDRKGKALRFVCRQTGSGELSIHEFLTRANIPLPVLREWLDDQQKGEGE